MILESIKYSQYENTPESWDIERFSIGKINLITGRNATGKSRTLNLIAGLANLICGEQKLNYKSGNYEVVFLKKPKNKIKYNLKFEDSKVIKEELIVGDKILMKRGKNGKGQIFAEKMKKMMDFQVPDNELATVTRRDSVQHSFFEDLYVWGKLTRHYQFGSTMGKDIIGLSSDNEQKKELNLKDANQVIVIFSEGIKKHGKKFLTQIKKDMKLIGYNIDDICLSSMPAKVNIGGVNVETKCLSIKESDINGSINQFETSQGMFRVLSLIIQLNFSQLESTPSCILIDDIGEGLDYERSQCLIKLLVKKIQEINVQLLMTTNDRFVMNCVPLIYWLIIERKSGHCKILNYENSKKIFDDFEYTGLNNFEFFTSDFYLKGLEKK